MVIKPFDISQDEYEQEIRDLEDLLECVGQKTKPKVSVSRSVLIGLISSEHARLVTAWELHTGDGWSHRSIQIKAQR